MKRILALLGAIFSAIRWSLALALATALGVTLFFLVPVEAGLHVVDSDEFWVTWARHLHIAEVLRPPLTKLGSSACGALGADLGHEEQPDFSRDCARSADAAIHAALAEFEEKLELNLPAIVGYCSGRDKDLHLSLPEMPALEGSGLGKAIVKHFCQGHAGSKICSVAAAFKLPSPPAWSHKALELAVEAPLGPANTLGIVVRGAVFTLWWGVCFLSLTLAVVAWRLKTLATMVFLATTVPGLLLALVGTAASWALEHVPSIGDSSDVAADVAGAMGTHVSHHAILLAVGFAAILARVFGHRVRVRIWERVEGVPNQHPIGSATLLEPIHLFRAVRLRRGETTAPLVKPSSSAGNPG